MTLLSQGGKIPPFSRYGQGDQYMSWRQILIDSGYDPDVVPFPGLMGPVFNVKAFGAALDGTTDDSAAIQLALNAAAFGDTVWVPRTAAGCVIGGTSLSVPDGVVLLGGAQGQQAGRWVPGSGISSGTTPGGTMFKITNTSNRPIKMGNNSAVCGFTFWYPSQLWSITSLAQSFVAYPATLQLGLTAGQAVFNCQVMRCHVLGATTFIEQLDTTGLSVNDLHVEDCSGVVTGSFLKVYHASDPIRLRNISLNPVFAASYVSDVTVGGDANTFRTKVAQAAKFLELGAVADLDAVNCFVLGMLYFAHYQNNFYSGDGNQEGSGRFVNCLADSVNAMVRYDRTGSNISPLSFTNCWCAPTFRPNGVAGDTATQAMIYLAPGVQSYRMALHNVRVFGTAGTNFLTNYTGTADYAFRAAGAVGGATQLLGNGVFVHNAANGFADANMAPAVLLEKFARDDNRTHGAAELQGDVSPTLIVGLNAEYQRFTTNLTANRTVTLSTTGAFHGARFRVVRSGLGAFTLDVGGLKTMPSATAAFTEVVFDGTAWRLAGYGTL